MAWICLCGFQLLPYIMMFKDKEWLIAASGIIIAVIALMGTIITVYIGAATVDDLKS